MIKGIQKRMIVVRPREGSCFESACFILKREAHISGVSEEAMLAEAMRIVSESAQPCGAKRKKRGISVLVIAIGAFIFGLAVGAVIIAKVL